MKRTFAILLLALTAYLVSTPFPTVDYDSSMDYQGDELATRSTNPRITEIAHITTNPVLNQNELEAQQLWHALVDTVFTNGLNNERYVSDPNYYKQFTPKELPGKSWNGVKVFYMQNLANYLPFHNLATYNNKAYLLPQHYDVLISDIGLQVTLQNAQSLSERLIHLSTSSNTSISSSIQLNITSDYDCAAMFGISFWEERNGYKYNSEITIRDWNGTLEFGSIWIKRIGNQNEQTVIEDNDNRDYGFIGNEPFYLSPSELREPFFLR